MKPLPRDDPEERFAYRPCVITGHFILILFVLFAPYCGYFSFFCFFCVFVVGLFSEPQIIMM